MNEQLLQRIISAAPSESNTRTNESSATIMFPNSEGGLDTYRVVDAPVMEQGLAARYPQIKSYSGVQVNGAGSARFDITPLGVHVVLMSPDRPTTYIDPVNKAASTYIVVSKADVQTLPTFQCRTVAGTISKITSGGSALKNADDGKLRQFRLAIAASSEYSAGWLNGSEANDAARTAKVIAALNASMIRVNAVMERDFGVRLNLVANNNLIVFITAGTDPFNSNSDTWNAQAKTTIDGAIGLSNYDIGHMVTEEGDFGNAGDIGTVCKNATKGTGYTSRSNWRSGIYWEEYILTHEMGHQLGANHTFSHKDESTIAQVEPGSGTSIMSYAGITGVNTDIQNIMDDYYHAISIQQATDYIKGVACGTTADNGNSVPTANAGSDYTIPKSTPFKLTGSGSDANAGNVLSFVWEQMDLSPVFPLIPNTTRTSGPQFRSQLPSSNTSRTFPVLASILDGTNTNKWEVLPGVARNMNFRFTVRDNNPGAGQNNSDDMIVTVNDASGPFKVTAPNTAASICPGNYTVTWDVAGSNVAPVNTTQVNILLSSDGGLTFPITLAASTPNDGSQVVNMPCSGTALSRVKIEAVGNIFFDISDANFTVGDAVAPTFTVPANATIFKSPTCTYNASVAITGDVTDEADNCSNALNATFTDATSNGSCIGETIITRTWKLIDGCNNTTTKLQVITVKDNTLPTFTAPPTITIYKDANCNYNASPAITGDVVNEADNCDPTLNATYSDVVAAGSCVGNSIITRTWALTDDCGNNTIHVQVINVVDNLAPVITNISTSPSVLWPVNHKMIRVTVNYNVADNCSAVTSTLSVSCNQVINGLGDGNTSPDWQVIDDHTVMLRAERSGTLKTDRIYTITIKSTDGCGKVSTAPAFVNVPHSQGNGNGNGNNRIVGNTNDKMLIGEEDRNELGVIVGPNPSKSFFTLYITGNTKEPVTIRVSDAHGRVIQTRTGAFANTTSRIEKLPASGTYFAEVVQGAKRKVVKLIRL